MTGARGIMAGLSAGTMLVASALAAAAELPGPAPNARDITADMCLGAGQGGDSRLWNPDGRRVAAAEWGGGVA